jgi:SAM-dependent methyltransferase
MNDWTAGYVADVGYTFGYYTELNPLRVQLAFLQAGLALPGQGTACELGFGQGLSANVHAAAGVFQWSGTDFNPSQAGFARELAAASGVSANLFDDAFADFCARVDLPDFDYIGLHGIWSWISDANRAVIVDFVRRKLKVGGVLYISYNTLPGWAAFAPMRHLLTQHALTMGADGAGIVSRIDGALSFADQLLATQPLYTRANPAVPERLAKVKEQNRHYLAHEYFNADWHPMYFADMARWLEPAKLTFACSANFLEHVDAINLTVEHQALLRDIADAHLRQTVRDFLVNQQFRKDYWVKGARKLSPLEQVEALRALRFVLIAPRSLVPLKVSGALGEASLSESVYNPVLDLLADHRPRSLGQLEQALAGRGLSFAQLLQAVLVLVGAGFVAPAQDDAQVGRTRKYCDKLNGRLQDKARSSGDIGFLACPLTSGGIPVGRFGQLFLLARAQGHKQPHDWAVFVLNILQAQGQRILKDGRALEGTDENLAELARQAIEFAETQLPMLKALQIA